MKNIIRNFNGKFILLLMMVVSLVSCKDFLDVVPKDQATDETIWATTGNADLFLNNVNASILPDSYKKLRIAEARFLRAYFYMLLYTHHGGVPIITNVPNITEDGDAVFQARNTDAETYQFIVNELAAIAPDLPI